MRKQRDFSLSLNAKANPFLGQYSGSGELAVKNFRTDAPVSTGSVDTIAGPQYIYGSDGSVRIINREYLGDVFAADNLDFQIINTFLSNPSSQESFPWLSGVANNFDKFCFNKLCYHFVTQCSTFTQGSVMIVPDYDSNTSAPQSKVQALSFKDAVRSPPWQESCCLLPKERLCNYKDYFVQLGEDLRLSNPATVYICTNNATDSFPIQGEIWVEYDIVLKCPTQSSLGVDAFGFISQPVANLFAGIKNPVPAFTKVFQSTGVVYPKVGSTITLPPGLYVISWTGAIVGGTVTGLDILAGFGVTITQISYATTGAVFSSAYTLIVRPFLASERYITPQINSTTGNAQITWIMSKF